MSQTLPTTELPWKPGRYRAPREDFAILAVPPLPQALAKARENHDALTPLAVNVQGRTVGQLRQWAREEVLCSARRYTAELLDGTSDSDSNAANHAIANDETAELLFVTGHQPSLFHPGVWVKNFAVNKLATQCGGLSLNLLVDTDVIGSTRIRVPVGDRLNPRIERVPFDADRPRGPWEENAILDRPLFESFGSRVEALLAPWNVKPILHEFWPNAVAASQRFPLLRDCFVSARARLERRWNAGNLELPISRLCELDPFLWFAGHVLAHLPRFSAIHNQVLAEYRRVNRVRSRTHPVPELKSHDGWTEAPFWFWRKGDDVRGRLFARQSGREVVLSDGREEFARLRLSPDMDACCAVEALRQLPAQGVRFRPRALMTTLFSRLCLADLFVHGIGGAKYDEMTDRILARFFNVTAPGFLTMTATLHASLADPFPVGHDDEECLQRRLRDLRWNADRFLNTENRPETAPLIAQKRELVQALKSGAAQDASVRRSNGERSNYKNFKRVQEVNRRLAELADDQSKKTADALEEVRRQLDANALLQDREFSFCLYPPEKLRRLMDSI